MENFDVTFEEVVRVEANTASEAEELAMQGNGIVISREMTDNTINSNRFIEEYNRIMELSESGKKGNGNKRQRT